MHVASTNLPQSFQSHTTALIFRAINIPDVVRSYGQGNVVSTTTSWCATLKVRGADSHGINLKSPPTQAIRLLVGTHAVTGTEVPAERRVFIAVRMGVPVHGDNVMIVCVEGDGELRIKLAQ